MLPIAFVFSTALARGAPGDVDLTFDPGGGANATVYAINIQPDNKILIGGSFTNVNGATRNRVARLNQNGSLDTTFMNGLAGADDNVTTVAVQTDGKVLLGGSFSSFNGEPRGRIARLNADGSLDTGFQNGMAGIDGGVQAISVWNNGKIVVGGQFSSVNGETRNSLVRLNPDGSTDNSYQTPYFSGFSTPIYAVVTQGDDKVLIAGSFTSVNGIPRHSVARFNPNGSLDTAFAGPEGFGTIFAMTLDSSGKVLIGGGLYLVNGVLHNRIARLNSDGSIDSGFSSGLNGSGGNVYSLVAQDDGKILAGGDFITPAGPTRRLYLARLNSNGSVDIGFAAAPGGFVPAIALHGSDGVLIGGGFTTINSVVRNRIARLSIDPPAGPRFVPPFLFASGSFEAGVQSSAGGEVVIFRSNNLVDWLPVYTNNAPFAFIDSDNSGQPMRFYRAISK